MLRRKLHHCFSSTFLIGASTTLLVRHQSNSSFEHPFDQGAHHDQSSFDTGDDRSQMKDEEFNTYNNSTSASTGGGGDASSNEQMHRQIFKESNTQREEFLRNARRRRKLENTTSRLLYEFHFLKKLCQKRPTFRQWLIRDDVVNMDPGNVQLSPSMQSAYMRVVNSKEKGALRQSIRDIVPVILYRHTEKQQPLLPRDNPNALIPDNEPATLNAKKREMFERRDSISAFQDERLIDTRSQNRLRWKIRLRLMRFQKQLAQQNASATRSILYSEQDAVGYFVFRAAPMYAALHRVFFELGKMMPHFVPRSMLDFGSGTGTAILVAKETYDPDGLALPLDRETKRTMNDHKGSVEWNLKELKVDLKRMSKVNEQRRKARFVAVASLIAKGELKLTDIPTDLRREIVNASKIAATRAKERERVDTLGRLKKFVETHVDWDDDEAIEKRLREIDLTNDEDFALKEEDEEFLKRDLMGEAEKMDLSSGNNNNNVDNNNNNKNQEKSWWEQYVEDEYASKEDAARRRLRPLQSIIAVEPAPGMVETAMNVLQDDVPNVSYQRYLNPDDASQQDLVIAAYSLSEIATAEERKKTVQDLWKRTRGVLILIEYANLPNFDLMMEARDAILSEKEVGLWDWQPTIVGPCPHEKRCPIRHSALGVKFKNMRICKTEATYRPTFIEQWVHRFPRFDVRRKKDHEPFTYMIFARNEMVPERAERRIEQQRKEEERNRRKREQAQRDLFKEAVRSKDNMYENVDDETLQRPIRGGENSNNSDNQHLQEQQQQERSVQSNSSSALLAGPATSSLSSISSIYDATGGTNTEGSQQQQQPLPFGFDSSKYSLDQAIGDNTPQGGLKSIRPGVVQYYETSNGGLNRITFPNIFPIATHRYNRQPFVGPHHQLQRLISPTELLVIRRDAQNVREKYQKMLHKYWRIALTYPRVSGKVSCHICTSDGDLIRAKVYRRFFGKGTRRTEATGGFSRWQYMGGWRFLKNAKLLSCVPTDIPMYSFKKMEQVDFPNTMLNHKLSVVEQTAMMHNAPVDDGPIRNIEVEDRDPITGEGSRHLASKDGQRTMTGSTLPPRVGVDSPTKQQQQQQQEGKSPSKRRQQQQQENDVDSSNTSSPGDSFIDSIYQTPEEVFEDVAERRTNELYSMMGRGQVTSSQIDGGQRGKISGKEWADAIRGAKRRRSGK